MIHKNRMLRLSTGLKSVLSGTLFFLLTLTSGAVPSVSAQDRDEPQFYPVLEDSFGRPTVDTFVNGKGPLPFILDTGASKSVVYRSLTALTGLQAKPNQSKRIITATGYKRVLVYPVEDFYVLGRTLSVEETVALPDIIGSDAKGLIGVDMLAGLALYLDMKEGAAAIMSPERAAVNYSDWGYIQGRPVAYGSLALEVTISGIDVPVIVDTGASDTVMNTAGMRAVTRGDNNGITQEIIRASISGGQQTTFTSLRVPNFNIGSYAAENMRLVVSDIPIFTLLGAKDVPAIILGIDFLEEQPFVIDFKNWRLYLSTRPERE